MSHIMLDLETMGNGPQAAIIAIGAVAFDESGISSEFYTQVSLASSMRAGGVVDASTVTWWLQQDADARSAFKDNEKAPEIRAALLAFARWFDSVDGRQVWGNGAAFDNTILGAAYRAHDCPQPWAFWNDRCYRTFRALHCEVPFERKGVRHNAVDDARSQAEHLIANAKAMGAALA